MTDFSAEKLRALDEQHRTRLITTLRNWQREMERSCDALRELGPDMEDAAMGNAHVAEALEEAADAILAMAEREKRMRGAASLVLGNADRPGRRMCFGGGPDGDDVWIEHREVDQTALDALARALGEEKA